MSLINQALKEEQRRRNTSANISHPPLVGMGKSRSNRGPGLLIGVTFAGLAMAGVVTFVLYFGSRFLEGETAVAQGTVDTQVAAATAAQSAPSTANQVLNPELLEELSEKEVAAVQKMLIERRNAKENPQSADSGTADTAGAETTTVAPAEPISHEELARMQRIVDAFSIQGIRKSGKDTRVFMNGRIQKLGDVVDIANQITLVGFTENELIFRDAQGNRFEKLL